MSQDAETARAPGPAGRLTRGTTLRDGRYIVEELTGSSHYAEVYVATDTQADGPVSIHLVHAKLLSAPTVAAAIETASKAAMNVRHKHVLQVLDFVQENSQAFVVTELLEGRPLRELLARKKTAGGDGFGVRGAKNILGGVCSGLEALHQHAAHGALSVDSVYVNKAGRVKVAEVGLGAALPAAIRAGIAKAPRYVASESARAGAPSPAADLFSVGHLLYELLVGTPLAKGGPRPSDIEGVSVAVDELVARCVAAPDKRPDSAAALNAALATALAQPSRQQAVVRASAQQPALRPSGLQSAAPSISSPGIAIRPSLAQSIAEPRPSGEHDAELAVALADAEERWLVSKGKLDYGPFTLAAVVDEINNNQILPNHIIIDKHSGERVAVEDHPLLGEVAEQAKQRRDDARRAQAEVSHATKEKRRGFTLYAFIGIGVVVLGAVAILVIGKLSKDKKDKSASTIGSLDDGSFTAKIDFSKQTKQTKKRRGKRRSGRSGGGGGGGDDDEGEEVNRLDMSEEGGDERLDNYQINKVVGRYGSRLGRCLGKTGSRSAAIKFIIKGTGRVNWVRVNGKKGGALYSCVNGVMRSMQFPKFDGARTRADFNMSL